MDPSSITGVVIASLKAIVIAKEFVGSIQRAPRSIQTLSDDLLTIEGLIRELGSLLDGFDGTTGTRVNRIVREPLMKCENIARQVDSLLRPYVRASEMSNVSIWKRFSFGFQESEVLQLRWEMSACKQSLMVAITSADLYTAGKIDRGLRRVQKHLGIESSSIAGSDIEERRHERIGEWVLETETIVEEEEIPSEYISPPQPIERPFSPGLHKKIQPGASSKTKQKLFPKPGDQIISKKELSRRALMLHNIDFTEFSDHVRTKDLIDPDTLSRIKDLSKRLDHKSQWWTTNDHPTAPDVDLSEDSKFFSKLLKPITSTSSHSKKKCAPTRPLNDLPPTIPRTRTTSTSRVSRQALVKHDMRFTVNGDKIRLFKEVDEDALDRVADLSKRLQPDPRLWW